MSKKACRISLSIIYIILLIAMITGISFATENDKGIECKIYDSFGELMDDTILIQPTASLTQPTASDIGAYKLEPKFYRSGDTTKVHVYMHYKGTDKANSINIKGFEIWNTNLLDRKQLVPTFSVGVRDFVASKDAYIPIRRDNPIKLAKSVKAVRVNIGTRRVYVIGHGWMEGNDPIGQWDVD